MRAITGASNLRGLATVRLGELVIHGWQVIQQPGQRAYVSVPQDRYRRPLVSSRLLVDCIYSSGTSRVRVADGLNVRTDGGYVVAPPSIAPRRARPWAWDVDAHVTDVPLAPAPDWLIDFVGHRVASDAAVPPWVETATGASLRAVATTPPRASSASSCGAGPSPRWPSPWCAPGMPSTAGRRCRSTS